MLMWSEQIEEIEVMNSRKDETMKGEDEILSISKKGGLNIHAPDFCTSKTLSSECPLETKSDTKNSFDEEIIDKTDSDSFITVGNSNQPLRRPHLSTLDEPIFSSSLLSNRRKEQSFHASQSIDNSNDMDSSFYELASPGSFQKQWSSLQIICPEPAPIQSTMPILMVTPTGELRMVGMPPGNPYNRGPQHLPMYKGQNSPSVGSEYYPYDQDDYGSYHRQGIPSPRNLQSHFYPSMINTPTSIPSPIRSPSKVVRPLIPIDGCIYQVQFKRAHRNFILAPSAPRNIIPGDFVKVEADRGEDMGIVLSKSHFSDFEEVVPTAGYRGRGFSSGQGDKKFLYRLATGEERASLVNKVEDEERALEVIREKVVEKCLPMVILDAEYQFDRHKLTFFFEADRRIDFRELVSELFSLYKTRIWMQQVDTSSLPLHDAGTELAQATGFLPYNSCSNYQLMQSPFESRDYNMQCSHGNGDSSFSSPLSYTSSNDMMNKMRSPKSVNEPLPFPDFQHSQMENKNKSKINESLLETYDESKLYHSSDAVKPLFESSSLWNYGM